MDELITVAPGVTRIDYGYGWELCGTMDALVASGFAKTEWFPNGIDRNGRGNVIRQKKIVHDGRCLKVRRPANGPCRVMFIRTTDEEAEYEEAHREEREQQRNANEDGVRDARHESITQCYADALSKPGGLKSEARYLIVASLGMVSSAFGLYEDKRVYFRFSREVRERARHLIVELNELFEESEMTPTSEVRARADVKFQSFIKTVLPST